MDLPITSSLQVVLLQAQSTSKTSELLLPPLKILELISLVSQELDSNLDPLTTSDSPQVVLPQVQSTSKTSVELPPLPLRTFTPGVVSHMVQLPASLSWSDDI